MCGGFAPKAPGISVDENHQDFMTQGSVEAPENWPSIWRWLNVSKRNAFELFPSDAYRLFRVSNRLVHTRLSVISRPETINAICATNSKSFRLTNLQRRILSPSLGEGLILAEGNNWKKQRRMAAKISANGRERQFQGSQFLDKRIENMIESWIVDSADERQIDLHSDLLMLAMDALSDALFGEVPIAADLSLIETVTEHRETIEAFDFFDAVGAPLWLQSSKMRKAKRIAARYNGIIQDHLDNKAIEQLDMSRDRKRDFVVSLMTGYESIANTCLWALYEYTKLDCAQQKKLIDAASAAPLIVDLNAQIDNPMIALLMETLRLYPPLPLIYRKAIRDSDSMDGRIFKSEVLCLSPWIVHRHLELWSDPQKFDIDRWVHKTPKSQRGFMPFGVGARQCIGQHIGSQISLRILQRCLSRIDLATSRSNLAVPRGGVTLRPMRPITFSVQERHTGRAPLRKNASIIRERIHD